MIALDLDYIARHSVWLYSAEKLYVLNQKIYNYIQRDSSIMHRPELKHAADINTTVEELDIFSSNNIPELKNM